jgi:hypothetical protein
MSTILKGPGKEKKDLIHSIFFYILRFLHSSVLSMSEIKRESIIVGKWKSRKKRGSLGLYSLTVITCHHILILVK